MIEWHKVADGDLPDNCRYVWTNEIGCPCEKYKSYKDEDENATH